MKKQFRIAALGILAAGVLGVGMMTHSRSDPAPAAPPAAAPDPATLAADPQVQQVAAANTDFGFRLLSKIAPTQSQPNVFFSPFSISQALTMTLNGAGGATHSDMAAALGLGSLSAQSINTANGQLLPSLENPDPKVEISVANALWVGQGTALNADFQAQAGQYYQAEATELNMNSPNAAATINGWVSKHTQGKIDQLVSPGDLRGAKVVLTNAVYFHGTWTQTFDKTATQDVPFTRGDGSQKTVPMMYHEGGYSYLDSDTFQAARLPYGSGRLALYVFLPKSPATLDDFVKSATAAQWETWRAQMKPNRINLYLPRFQASQSLTLNDPLTQLGMGSVFGSGADFTPMGLTGGFIGKVIHKSVLEVNEEGTVAAAATGVTMRTLSIMAPPRIEMRVDHPFFCAIRDDTTGTILFCGTISDPQ